MSWSRAMYWPLAVVSDKRDRPLAKLRNLLARARRLPPSSAEAQQVHALVEASAAEVTRWEKVHSAYQYHLATVSLIVHPWDLVDSTRQTSVAMKRQLHAETRALEALIETNGLPVKKKAWTRSASSLLACRPWWTFGGRGGCKILSSLALPRDERGGV